MPAIVNDAALDTLFRAARCHYAWLARPVGDTLLRALCELVKLAPVAAPDRLGRVVFLRSAEAKARLCAAVPAAWRNGVETAPIVAIVFCPAGEPGTVAGAGANLLPGSLILAARALGLDCGPVWEFDRALVDGEFFPDGGFAASFVCALGYGDDSRPSPQEKPFGAGEACVIL